MSDIHPLNQRCVILPLNMEETLIDSGRWTLYYFALKLIGIMKAYVSFLKSSYTFGLGFNYSHDTHLSVDFIHKDFYNHMEWYLN